MLPKLEWITQRTTFIDEALDAFLVRCKDDTMAAFAHQDYPFDELVRLLDMPQDPSRNPLFDVMVVLQNTRNLSFELPGLEVQPLDLDYGTAQFDLLWSFAETDAGLALARQVEDIESNVQRVLQWMQQWAADHQ